MTGPGLPLTIGSISPRQKWRSEPHMPPDVIFVRIPPGPTGAGGSSVHLEVIWLDEYGRLPHDHRYILLPDP